MYSLSNSSQKQNYCSALVHFKEYFLVKSLYKFAAVYNFCLYQHELCPFVVILKMYLSPLKSLHSYILKPY